MNDPCGYFKHHQWPFSSAEAQASLWRPSGLHNTAHTLNTPHIFFKQLHTASIMWPGLQYLPPISHCIYFLRRQSLDYASAAELDFTLLSCHKWINYHSRRVSRFRFTRKRIGMARSKATLLPSFRSQREIKGLKGKKKGRKETNYI